MLIRLSIKNIRKSIKDYAIYFLHWYWVSVSLCIQCDRRAVFDAGGVQDKVRFHRSDGVGNFKHEYCCIPDPWISDCVCQPLSDEKKETGNLEFI